MHLPSVSLTRFVDFVATSGTPRLTVVRNTKKDHGIGYDPRADFYKRFRDGIREFHKRGMAKADLAKATSTSDAKKRNHYQELRRGYSKFLGRKSHGWLNGPAKVHWDAGDLSIGVNPELALQRDGERYLVKLYLKKPAISKVRIDTVLHLMRLSLGGQASKWKCAVLDVRRGKLYDDTGTSPDLTPLLVGEASAFASIYRALP